MLEFETLQKAGRRARFEAMREGLPRPGHSRTRERTPEKQALLLQAVVDSYRRTPPRIEREDGRTVLILPWML